MNLWRDADIQRAPGSNRLSRWAQKRNQTGRRIKNNLQIRIIELLRPQTRKPGLLPLQPISHPDTFQGTDCTEQ